MALIIIIIFSYLLLSGLYFSLIRDSYRDFDGEASIESIFWPFALPCRMGRFLGSKTNLTSLFNFIINLFNKTIHLIKTHMKKLLGIGAVFLLLTVATWGVTAYVTYLNQYATLTAQYEAQDKVDQVIYDEVWKTIKQEANITDVYAAKFKEIYVEVMDARYKDGAGQLMQWITEQNPNFTPELYGRLMNTIEAKRAEFTNNQKKLIAIHAELKKLTTTIPSAWFLGGRTVKEPRLVTSTRTGEAFESGKDDDTTLYPTDTSK